jgi:hypothetical protein
VQWFLTRFQFARSTITKFVCAAPLIAFFGSLVMCLWPAYAEYTAVKAAMNRVVTRYDFFTLSHGQRWDRLRSHFQQGGVTSPTEACLRFDGVIMHCQYQYRRQWLGNIDLVVSFAHTAEAVHSSH